MSATNPFKEIVALLSDTPQLLNVHLATEIQNILVAAGLNITDFTQVLFVLNWLDGRGVVHLEYHTINNTITIKRGQYVG